MTRTREHDLPARTGSEGERIHLDPRTKLALIAAMAVAVALAPGPAYEMILMAAACAFSAALGRTRAGVIMLALYAAVIAAARLAPHLDGVAARTALASFLLLLRKVLACSLGPERMAGHERPGVRLLQQRHQRRHHYEIGRASCRERV